MVSCNRGRNVYNLDVAGMSEYVANGLVVHNCDSLRYAVMGVREPVSTGLMGADPEYL